MPRKTFPLRATSRINSTSSCIYFFKCVCVSQPNLNCARHIKVCCRIFTYRFTLLYDTTIRSHGLNPCINTHTVCCGWLNLILIFLRHILNLAMCVFLNALLLTIYVCTFLCLSGRRAAKMNTIKKARTNKMRYNYKTQSWTRTPAEKMNCSKDIMHECVYSITSRTSRTHRLQVLQFYIYTTLIKYNATYICVVCVYLSIFYTLLLHLSNEKKCVENKEGWCGWLRIRFPLNMRIHRIHTESLDLIYNCWKKILLNLCVCVSIIICINLCSSEF